MSSSVIITGANRGIGLSFARLYHQQGCEVCALCRNPSPELSSLGVTVIDGIDVRNDNLFQTLPQKLAGTGTEHFDLLINNAGILRNEILGQLDIDQIRDQFEVNALGPLKITEALLPMLKDGGKIALITSRMGSIEDNTSGGRYGYRMSKAALNIAGVSLACDLASRNIAVGIYHPGLVGTEMIGGHGDITPDEAAERLAQRINELKLSNSGSFWHSNGEILPW
jgi:NAD(P)-dependent dehydrogenase (short-subunit alcohol dehydrogenase family)